MNAHQRRLCRRAIVRTASRILEQAEITVPGLHATTTWRSHGTIAAGRRGCSWLVADVEARMVDGALEARVMLGDRALVTWRREAA